jgi:DNA polymerase I-like protein with 3'-5' exonuclease and polymerase domains
MESPEEIMFVFDIESDGLLPGQCDADSEITKVHCINGIDRRTGREYRFTDHPFYQDLNGDYTTTPTKRDGDISAGLALLCNGDEPGGHNIIGYDLPALKYLYPEKAALPRVGFDSMVLGKLAVPNLKDHDFAAMRKGKFGDHKIPAGGQQLKHWAIRAGKALKTHFDPKDYGHTWKTMPFTEIMDDYCMDDCRANVDVIEFMEERLEHCPLAVELEIGTAEIITRQQRHGIKFDVEAANELARVLYVELNELEAVARRSFAPFYKKDGKRKTPAKPHRRFKVSSSGGTLRTVKGAEQRGYWCTTIGEHQPIELVEFNPGSRQHIENRLRWKYNWEPTELTKTGLAEITEATLGTLPFAEAVTITSYMTVQKRLSQLAEGKQAWLKAVKPNGRIYGRVDQLGTGTGRMSHFGPNLAQVPQSGKPYGAECRSLFVADTGRTILGCDADALELRILAHFLAKFDGGTYVQTVLEGSKEDGTDMHSRNRDAVGLAKRDTAKTWFYAFIYGAADFKLGTVVISEWDEAKLLKFYGAYAAGQTRRTKITAIGRRSRARLLSSLPAFKHLVETVHTSAERGHLYGLDKRNVPIRSKHSALNFLCQGAGALVMKRALITMFKDFKREGLDVHPLLNVHDEVQLSILPEEKEHVGRITTQAITEAGRYFGLRCPLAGDAKVGLSWNETH